MLVPKLHREILLCKSSFHVILKFLSPAQFRYTKEVLYRALFPLRISFHTHRIGKNQIQLTYRNAAYKYCRAEGKLPLCLCKDCDLSQARPVFPSGKTPHDTNFV